MVKPARSPALPKQPNRENERLQQAIEAVRRDEAAKGRSVDIQYTHAEDASASSVDTDFVWHSPKKLVLQRVEVAMESTVAADSSNYARLFIEAFDGFGTQKVRTLGEVTNKEKAFTAYLPREMELDRTIVPQNWIIRFREVKVGTGIKLPTLHVILEATEYAR